MREPGKRGVQGRCVSGMYRQGNWGKAGKAGEGTTQERQVNAVVVWGRQGGDGVG